MKKTKLIITFIAVSLLHQFAFAQITDFDLSNYKLPDLKRQSLETNFSFSNSSNSTTRDFEQLLNNENLENVRNSLNSNISATYNYYLNTRKLQRNFRFSTNNEGYHYKNIDNDTSKTVRSNFYASNRLDINNRIYFGKNFFIATDLILAYDFRKYNDLNESPSINNTYKLNQNSIRAEIPLKIGVGRIEPISDAKQAVYILNELIKENRTKSNFSDEEILELAKLISEVNNERFLDNRIKRKENIESLDSFLLAKNYITKVDARYYTTLFDIWEYGNENRNSGRRFSLGAAPIYEYSKSSRKDELPNDVTKDKSLGIKTSLQLDINKPINLKWQSNSYVNASYNLFKNSTKDSNSENIYKDENQYLAFQIGQNFSYYPNTRTNLNIGLSASYNETENDYFDPNNTLESENDMNRMSSSLNFSFNYYISEHFRLNIDSNIWYSFYEDNRGYEFSPDQNSNRETTDLSTNFSISLTYLLF